MPYYPSTNLRSRLRNGETLIGSWINSGSPIVAELMAAAGFDFLCVDVEHSAVDLPQTQQLFQAIHSGNPSCETMVRLHGIDYSFVKRYLDAGARGIIAPLVRTPEEAATIVEATKYPPQGNRGVGFCRANQYGLNLQKEFDRANDVNLVAVQIEHIDAVNNIDQIVSVEGVDAVFIGPYDLSASMGITAQFDHPDYIAARDRILESCKRHNIVPGIHVVAPDPEQVSARAAEGYRLIAYSLDITMLTTACFTGLQTIRATLPSQ
jgi:2-dehydro-3-deoxyglucarate aldolase